MRRRMLGLVAWRAFFDHVAEPLVCMLSQGGGGGPEFFNHYKNDLERHAHIPSGVAGADLKSQSGGALRTPTLSRFSLPMTCTIPLPNLNLPRAGRNSPGGHRGVGL